MKKKHALKTWVILIIYFITTCNNYAQTSTEKQNPYSLGTTNDELPTKKWTNFLSPYAAILNLLIIS